MHPPFIFTDHKVGPQPHPSRSYPSRSHVRRSTPERLDLSVGAGWPPVPLIAPRGPLPLAPSGLPLVPGVRLVVVPPPRNTLRDVLGRWMIRTGQRMIMSHGQG